MTNGISMTEYMTFDNFGRLTQSSQITDGQTYTSSYQYNLSGALVQETYPSGRVVNNEFEPDGDLAKIFGKATPGATERTYANNFTYSADGKIERLRLGSGVWESAKFNSRLQVTELAVGWGPSSGSIWKMTTEYGEWNGTTVDAAKNSGNIGKQTVGFSGLAQPFVQTFAYDSLQRLTEAKETSNGDQTWREIYDYDRYGNRTTHNKFTGTIEVTQTDETRPEIDAAKNRFKPTEGYTFDANGNIVVDYSGRQFIFNGDNKQTEVKDAQNRLVGKYFYDGEGKRVKKLTYDQFGVEKDVTVFVYSNGDILLNAKLIAEYTTEVPPTNPTTRFTITDQLGSPRVILDSAGDVVSRRDFLPFGEEIAPDTTYRTDTLKYGRTDNVRQKFTGYQNDAETGLDFAEARMYENRHGRFTAVDPLLASGKSADPQTFNRYVYVMNNPLIFIDPEGLQAGQSMWFRTRRDGGRSFALTRGEKPDDGRRWERWDRTENVRSADGTVQEVRSSGFVGVGVWDRSQLIPSQGLPADTVSETRSTGEEMIRSVGKNAVLSLVDRITNPDGISVGGTLPIIGAGGSVTLTRNFDVVTSFHAGATFPNDWDSNILSGRNVLGGISIQATIIAERETPDRASRLAFFTGQSTGVGGCIRLCAGATFVPQPTGTPRVGVNLGISLTGAPSAGASTGVGYYQFNLHCTFFGPTEQNGRSCQE